MYIAIINGPNLNLLGKREIEIYGAESFESYLKKVSLQFKKHEFSYYQSNIEGELIDHIQSLENEADGMVINPGGYSHTSVAIADAIAAVQVPAVEVHISNIYARETYRRDSITATKCLGVISGLGLHGYEMAIHYLINRQ